MRTTRSALLATVLSICVLAAVAGLASPAGAAFYNQGVKTVTFHEATDSCDADLGIGCTTNAGDGTANRMQVLQEPTGSGGLRFQDFATTAASQSNLWLAATLSAECRSGYSLLAATVRPDWVYDSYGMRAPDEVVPWWNGVPVSVPDAKSMPAKKLALNVPVDRAFAGDGHGSMVLDFETLEDVYAYGEARIDQRIASGQNEATARSDTFVVQTWVAMHADVRCDGNVRGRIFVKKMPRYIPLTLEFVGVTRAPIHRGDQPADLAAPATVTDVDLAVVPDPDDACTLHLSGTILANGDTEVTYRFEDQWGAWSNGFTIDVVADEPTFVSHSVAVPTAGNGLDGPSLATDEGHGDIGGLANRPTTDVTGTYRLLVQSPNHVSSDIVGFSVTPCPAAAPTSRSGSTPGLRLG